MKETQARRVLAYAGRAGDLVQAIQQITADPATRVNEIDSTHILPLDINELACLYGLLANLEGRDDMTAHGPDRRLFGKARALAIAAGLIEEPTRPATPAVRLLPEGHTLADYDLRGWWPDYRPDGQFEAEAADVRARACPHCGAGMGLRLFRRGQEYLLFAVCPTCGEAVPL